MLAGYEMAPEGPFGDHTGYYNEQDWFPVFTIDRITTRRDPIYHSTYTGKPPDEPAVLGVALNEVFVPILQKQYPEIVDFYLPPEGCSYRMAVVSIRKQYAGHAKRVMFGIWGFLRQFMYTKFIVVVDDDVNARDWKEVIWAITTRMDPARDTTLIENTPIDYLDFASPVSGLGSKMGMDATNKWAGETTREWGRRIEMDDCGKEAGRRALQGARPVTPFPRPLLHAPFAPLPHEHSARHLPHDRCRATSNPSSPRAPSRTVACHGHGAGAPLAKNVAPVIIVPAPLGTKVYEVAVAIDGTAHSR